MNSEIVHYIVNQSSGVVIALVLIWRIEGKLDTIVSSISDLTKSLIAKGETK